MTLVGKNILILGGNGFVGSYMAARFVDEMANVTVLSRKGPKYERPQNQKIDWLISDFMKNSKHHSNIKNADTVVHTIGTLIDTSITRGRKLGQPGTYEYMNRDTLLRTLQIVPQGKQIFYLSAVGHPPFIHRYAETKQQAENALLNSGHEGYVIKPGFIYDWDVRKWSIPLRYTINGWKTIYEKVKPKITEGTLIQRFIKQFEVGQPTSLSKIANSVAYVIRNGNNEKILKNQQFQELNQLHQNLKNLQNS